MASEDGLLQPLFVTITVYNPEAEMVICWVVSPVDQRYELKPDGAASVSVLLLHTDTFPTEGVIEEIMVGLAGILFMVAVTGVLTLSQANMRLT